MKKNEERLESHESSLMVVASLIATVAFQIATNPPGGVWDDDKDKDSNGKALEHIKWAGESVFAYNYPEFYEMFCIATTVAFMASLSIILLLMSGLPIGWRFFRWILMVATYVGRYYIHRVVLFASAFCVDAPQEYEPRFISASAK